MDLVDDQHAHFQLPGQSSDTMTQDGHAGAMREDTSHPGQDFFIKVTLAGGRRHLDRDDRRARPAEPPIEVSTVVTEKFLDDSRLSHARGSEDDQTRHTMSWIITRTYCSGTPQDYAAVHAIQDQYKLVPLSAYGKPYTPPAGTVDPSIDMKTPVRDQVNGMDVSKYFNLLATLMKDNPPTAEDAPIVARMAKIGLVPGQPFDSSKLDPAVVTALQGVPKDAFGKIMANFKNAGTMVNGWLFSTKMGVYGTDYLTRATTTAIGLGANRPQDAVYPTSEVGADGKPYDGAANKYVVHIDKGQMPPVNGFWSLTMYNAQYFFVDNPLNRYNLSSRASSSRMRTDRWICICRPTHRARPRKRTGCPRQREDSSRCCGCIGQRRPRLRSSTVHGSLRR